MPTTCFVSYELHPTTMGGAGVLIHHAAEALLRRHGSAGPVELPGGVSAYRLSLAQLAGAEAADSPAAGGKAKPVPREAARCAKLVLRPQKPPAK